MNCHDAERLLFSARDGALDVAQHTALAAHLAQCPACRTAETALAESAAAWRTASAAVPTPAIEKEWHAIRRRLRSGEPSTSGSSTWWRSTVLAVAGAAAVAAVVFLGPSPSKPDTSTPGRDSTYVSYVSVYGGAENTMVYEDPDSGWLVVWVGDTTQTSGT